MSPTWPLGPQPRGDEAQSQAASPVAARGRKPLVGVAGVLCPLRVSAPARLGCPGHLRPSALHLPPVIGTRGALCMAPRECGDPLTPRDPRAPAAWAVRARPVLQLRCEALVTLPLGKAMPPQHGSQAQHTGQGRLRPLRGPGPLSHASRPPPHLQVDGAEPRCPVPIWDYGHPGHSWHSPSSSPRPVPHARLGSLAGLHWPGDSQRPPSLSWRRVRACVRVGVGGQPASHTRVHGILHQVQAASWLASSSRCLPHCPARGQPPPLLQTLLAVVGAAGAAQPGAPAGPPLQASARCSRGSAPASSRPRGHSSRKAPAPAGPVAPPGPWPQVPLCCSDPGQCPSAGPALDTGRAAGAGGRKRSPRLLPRVLVALSGGPSLPRSCPVQAAARSD